MGSTIGVCGVMSRNQPVFEETHHARGIGLTHLQQTHLMMIG